MKYINKIIFILATAGLAFAGYLSSYKLINNNCALGESCPYFIGLPACYYGFFMYLTITIFAFLLVIEKVKEKKALNAIIGVSLLGICFAGYFTLSELPVLFKSGFSAYVFGLPTCALGLIFYIAIFSLSFYKRFKKHEN